MKTPFLETTVDSITWDALLPELEQRIVSKQPCRAIPINTDVYMKMHHSPALKDIIEGAEYRLVDGKPLIWISRWLKTPIAEKISGSDLSVHLMEIGMRHGWKVFILGGMPEVNAKACQQIQTKWPQLGAVAGYSPRWGFENDPQELETIRQSIMQVSPDILLVCLGCPKQEYWMMEHAADCQAVFTLAAGATVDFLAGSKKRCPAWVSAAGLEWFYRFLKEPTRLFKRYFIDDMQIFRVALAHQRKGKQHV